MPAVKWVTTRICAPHVIVIALYRHVALSAPYKQLELILLIVECLLYLARTRLFKLVSLENFRSIIVVSFGICVEYVSCVCVYESE